MRKVFPTIALLAASAIFSALLAASPAQAVHHSDVTAQTQHFLDCLDLMVSDPAKHAEDCGPGHEFTGKFSHEGDIGPGGGFPPPKVTNPCEDDECCCEDNERCCV